ncbi:MarR family winged helix-turn-helix transcriptional regulator [Flavihumibacter cheonanensis]|uniref:MarR family winged helix-turn-helix transcriptional regulator n=1 Tax=Flavihumibacter cheonanensis TaxID=1442385 RepID=UPI001EF84D43|nr:MarR family transcriptional regulator [Flavihumibacter cheonanensis]MCG7751432.1 MarR family transcriptional regulator [Flavihumibacter cheonanensis]
MSFYQQTGVLFFGSRLRRISESFLADVNAVYKKHQIHFDAAWFPVFYMLSQKESLTIRDISEELEVSHSAASQLISKLQEKGLIKTNADKEDGRKKVVSFTPKGQKLLKQVEPVWTALQTAMEELLQQAEYTAHLMEAISQTETALREQSIFNRIEKHLA